MRRLYTIMKGLVALTLSAASIPASVIYSFVGTGQFVGLEQTPAEPVAFQLTVPAFLSVPGCNPGGCRPLSFTCAQLDSNTNCLLQGDSPSVGFFRRFNDVVLFAASNTIQYDFYFPLHAFEGPGVYNPDFGLNTGILTVTVTAIPEPTTILLVLSGICLCWVVLQRHQTGKKGKAEAGFFQGSSC